MTICFVVLIYSILILLERFVWSYFFWKSSLDLCHRFSIKVEGLCKFRRSAILKLQPRIKFLAINYLVQSLVI